MYFTVFLIEPRLHVLVPHHWIYDPEDDIYTKFLNSGLNSSQQYKCYWKSTSTSLDQFVLDLPNPNFVPIYDEANFDAPRATVFPCDEGTYACKLVKSESKYIDYC